jgi:hypothetical protein
MMNIPQSFGFALISLLLLGLPSELKAQTHEPSKVIECTYIYWDGIPEGELYFRMGEEYHPMVFRHGSRAAAISVARMERFEVFRKVDKPLEGEALYEFIAEAAVPHDASSILFLIMAPNQEDGDHRVFALDDSTLVFGQRTFRFVNQVDVDGDIVMQSNVDEKGGFIPCIMRDPEGETIFGTRLFAQPNGREIVFIRPSPIKGRKAPSIKFISQLIRTSPVEIKQ